MFEMVSPRNIIIVQVKQEEEDIYFHGARDLNTLKELEPFSIAKERGWNCVKTFQFNSIQVLSFFFLILFSFFNFILIFLLGFRFSCKRTQPTES